MEAGAALGSVLHLLVAKLRAQSSVADRLGIDLDRPRLTTGTSRGCRTNHGPHTEATSATRFTSRPIRCSGVSRPYAAWPVTSPPARTAPCAFPARIGQPSDFARQPLA